MFKFYVSPTPSPDERKLEIYYNHLLAYTMSSSEKESLDITGYGKPLPLDELDNLMSDYLAQWIEKIHSTPNAILVMVFDIDGTMNYRYSGSSLTATMGFFGGTKTIQKLTELQAIGTKFVALTGAPENNVRTLFNQWLQRSTLLPELLKLFNQLTIIQCYPADIKGNLLWHYVADNLLSQPNLSSLIISFLDDSVKNASTQVPQQFKEKFQAEGALYLTDPIHSIKQIELTSTWFATGMGDLNEKQQAWLASGADYSYGKSLKIDREKCLSGQCEILTIKPITPLYSYCN
ncbi:hypothetical protein ACNVED_16150 (plasmid) [Legionella sp. D16C41]|uniref:hypothetical protein n=1 Tax=Legionella sp. D16C41 TaxID=3402688 RepID=UPI003AF6F11E